MFINLQYIINIPRVKNKKISQNDKRKTAENKKIYLIVFN